MRMPSRFRQRGFYLPWFGGGGPPPATDPYIADVIQLCHFDVDSGGGTFTQTIGPHAFSNGGGDAALDTTNKVFGTGSCGLTTADVNCATNAAYTLGSGDFSKEVWGIPTAISGAQVWFDGRPGVDGAYLAIYSSGADLFLYVNATNVISATGALTGLAGVKVYIVVTRTGTTTRMYVGVFGGGTAALVGSFTDTTNYLQMPLRLGRSAFASGQYAGNFDDYRLTAHGRTYTGSTIPVPTAAFPDT